MNGISGKAAGKEMNVMDFVSRFGIPIIFAVMVVVFSVINPIFITFDNISNLMYSTAANGIAVIGTSMIIFTGGIDISIGAIMFSAGCVTVLAGNMGLPMPVVLLLAILLGGVMGAFNGYLVAFWKMVPLMVTLATMVLYRGIMLFTINEGYLQFTSHDYVRLIVETKFLGIPISVYMFVVLIALFQFVITRTKFGWHLFAIGNNVDACRKIGINVRMMLFSVYTLNGLLGGLAGFVLVGMIGEISPTFAQGGEFTMITAAVLGGVALTGGKGSIFPGAFIGAVMIYAIANGLNIISANPYAYTIVTGIVIFIAVALSSMKNKSDIR